MMQDNGQNKSGDWTEEVDPLYILRLFISGTSPVSVRAINNVQAICEKYLKGKYQLEIIDAHQQPLLVKSEDVIAVPILIKNSPFPKRRLVGDMSDIDKVLRGLGLDQYQIDK